VTLLAVGAIAVAWIVGLTLVHLTAQLDIARAEVKALQTCLQRKERDDDSVHD
jgi:hypothetical protein